MIQEIVQLTIKQMKERYVSSPKVRRGLHPKDHGCVTARFEMRSDLSESPRIGVFAHPGKRYDAYMCFSNAALKAEVADSGRHKKRV